MIFKRFYKVLLLQQEGNCPQTANVSHIHVLLTAIFGMLRIHSQLKHLRVSRGNIQRLKSGKNGGKKPCRMFPIFFVAVHHFLPNRSRKY